MPLLKQSTGPLALAHFAVVKEKAAKEEAALESARRVVSTPARRATAEVQSSLQQMKKEKANVSASAASKKAAKSLEQMAKRRSVLSRVKSDASVRSGDVSGPAGGSNG